MSASAKKSMATAAKSSSRSIHQPRTRDLMWGRPVFKAPSLPNPRAIFDPMPFIDSRPARDVGKRA